MSKASNDASREKNYKLIGGTQHSMDLLKNDIERMEDKDYHLIYLLAVRELNGCTN